MNDNEYGDSNQQNIGSQQQYNSDLIEGIKERLPEGLMEKLPGGISEKIESALSEAAQAERNKSSYEYVEPEALKIEMNPKLCIAAVIIGFGGGLLFMMICPPICVICLGIMFTILGIGAVGDKKFSFQRYATAFVIPLFGVLFILIGVFMLLQLFIPTLSEGNFLGIAIGIAFAVLLLLTFALIFISYRYKRKVCTEQVQARCVYVKERKSVKDGHTYYEHAPVFEFCFRGNTYNIAENYSSAKKPLVGDICEIHINPNEPTEFYRKKPISKGWIIIICIFIALAVFMLT